ncbi:MAG: AAA family ATPase [Lachnospiraceae bacterium]|nr:AAA family ATPase [Lachnospiraceae bacterium]
MKSCKNYPQDNPVVVLYAYSKLLSMDEKSLSLILDEKELEELIAVRKIYEKNSIDHKLVKTGAPLIIPYSDSIASKYRDRLKHIEDKEQGSVELIGLILEALPSSYKELFSEGNGIDDVIAFQKELMETRSDSSDASEEDMDLSEDEMKIPDERPSDDDIDDFLDFDKDDPEEDMVQQSFSSISERYISLSKALLDVVKGQNTAVLKFVRGCFQGELFNERGDNCRPVAYFFFFGPPGVGKTLLAKTAADNMGRHPKVFDMSEFSSESSYEQLVGFSSTYKDSQKGILTDLVQKYPDAVLVFDEIEKANIKVIRLFLQILGSGKLTDAYTKKSVSFENTIIIFTSNVGKDLYADRSVKLSNLPERVVLDAISGEKGPSGNPILSPEICSRIAAGNMIMFDHLSVRQLAKMVNENFEKVVALMEKEYGCRISYDPALPMLFLHNRGGAIDARIATRQSENFLKNELFELTRQLENHDDVNLKTIRFDIEWTGISDELKRLFSNEGKTEVLVMADDETVKCFTAPKDKYIVYHAKSLKKAKEYLKHDISAVFIDPRSGTGKDKGRVLSISDYNSAENRFFRELVRIQSDLPIFILEVDSEFSDVDRRTYIQEGAEGTVRLYRSSPRGFSRKYVQLMEELYMEKENLAFSQKGWVIDFGTKQIISDDHEKAKICFYDLRKTQALDMESRDVVLKETERPKVRFSDIIGARKAKEELAYFINYLKNPKQFLVEGGKPPKGVLLYGPPGTGKTMLAKAMAGESDVTFIQTSASEFKNPYAGVSEENIRELFKRARRYSPAIIFIDEIDAIGRKREGGLDQSLTESMLDALLKEMDGFATDGKKPVFVLAATNYGVKGEDDGVSALDEALVRRFDNRIYVDLPTEEDRKIYINRIIESKKISDVSEQVMNNIAERTTGQSLAIIQNVVDLAFRNAVKDHKKITDGILLNALEEYMHGERKQRDAEYYKKVAIHEVGHAYVSYIGGDKPSYITIESRGSFGGYMQHSNQEDVPEYTREELIGRIRTCLAGRAAEYVFYGKDKSLNTGASSDLENATNYAWSIICRYGMEDGQLIVLKKDEILKSPLAADYVKKVNDLLKEEMNETVGIIEKAKNKIRYIADELIRENRLTGKQFEELMNVSISGKSIT